MTKIIWFIDENDAQVKTIPKVLNRGIRNFILDKDTLKVSGILARENISDYVDILTNKQTVSIIIDQRLMTRGTTNYNGIDLAEYFRSINPKIPIYILTAWEEDQSAFSEREWNVEYIFSKAGLNDKNENYRNKIIQRILRHIDVYQDILDSREKRFGELIRKSLIKPLEEDEKQELETIQLERSSSIAAAEIESLSQLDNLVSDLKSLYESINETDEK